MNSLTIEIIKLKQKKKKKCYRCHIVCSLDILIKTCNSIGALSNFNLAERKKKKNLHKEIWRKDTLSIQFINQIIL